MKTIIHEVRNHLAVAVANIEAFRDGILEPTEARLAAVLQALSEVDVLLDDMPITAVVKQPDSLSQTIDVCGLIANEVLAFEAPARERGIHFSVKKCDHKHADCQQFNGDPVRVAEIVANLLSNAIRYTPAGGCIDVDCHRVDDSLVLAITDDGPGIDRVDGEHIFECGFRGSAAAGHPGSGLGLTLTKRYVEEHGGRIDVHNVPGRGAQFTVRMPGMPGSALQADGSISLL